MLGIISIIGCFCYAIAGLIYSIIALILANKDMALYNANPGRNMPSSYANLKAGRICAIIAMILSILCVLMIIGIIAMVGIAGLSDPNHFFQQYR